MAFDECVRQPATPEQTSAAVDRTIRWARRCRDAHQRDDQMLFGIVQGGTDPRERDRCAAPLLALEFPGYAIGGLSVGEDRDAMLATLDHTEAMLPRGKPRKSEASQPLVDAFARWLGTSRSTAMTGASTRPLPEYASVA